MGADALLRGAQKEPGQKPLVEGNMGTLEYGADLDGELLAASVALVVTLSARQGRRFVYRPAIAAHAAIGPKQIFKILAGLGSVLKDWVVEFVCHVHIPSIVKRYRGWRAESSI
jgi:hypothetical protein